MADVRLVIIVLADDVTVATINAARSPVYLVFLVAHQTV
jgi:hypothetical protein